MTGVAGPPKPWHRWVAFAWFVGASVLAGAEAQQPAFRARTDVVSLPVSVMKGREPVTGLTAADFAVTDNGVRQTVDAVSLEVVPLDLTLVLTEFPVARTDEHRRTLLSGEAIRRLLRPADRLRIVLADDKISGRLAGWDFSVLSDEAARELVWGTPLANGFKGPISELRQRTNREFGFGVSLIDALFYALAWPVDADRRHLVVAFTDGHDTASTLEIDRFPELAGHSDAVLHAVLWATPGDGGQSGGRWTTNPGAHSREWETSFRVVDEAVRRTGGTLQRTNQAPGALASIIADFRSSYVLRYTPRGVPLGGWHDIGVKVTRPGSFRIRARKGYEGGPAV